MFGVVHACRRTLGDELFGQWQAHLCGLCLQLRDTRGQLSRALTNTDAIALSVLTEAQQPAAAERRTAGPCALRGMRTARVVRAGSPSTRLGATASLTLAAARAQDLRAEQVYHLGMQTLRGRAGAVLAEPLRRRALADEPMARAMRAADALDALSRQGGLEASVRPGDSVLTVTAPTAAATAEIFAASAVVAGRPGNEPVLREMGSAFGTLAHLLDAVTDLDEDRRTGSFNPITATGTPPARVRRECARLVGRIRDAFDRLTLTDGRLARALLVDGTHDAVHRAFGASGGTCAGPAVTHPGQLPGPDTASPTPPVWPGAPGHTPDKPPTEPPRPPFWPNVLPWVAVYCTGYACCASHENPCTGRQHQAGCSGCDGSCCECGGCCDCGDGCCCDCDCNC